MYRLIPWKLLVKAGVDGTAVSEYGRKLMRDMMAVYDGNQRRYAQLAGRGFRMLAEAVEAGVPFEWIPGAGRNANADAPDAVNALIERLLSSAGS